MVESRARRTKEYFPTSLSRLIHLLCKSDANGSASNFLLIGTQFSAKQSGPRKESPRPEQQFPSISPQPWPKDSSFSYSVRTLDSTFWLNGSWNEYLIPKDFLPPSFGLSFRLHRKKRFTLFAGRARTFLSFHFSCLVLGLFFAVLLRLSFFFLLGLSLKTHNDSPLFPLYTFLHRSLEQLHPINHFIRCIILHSATMTFKTDEIFTFNAKG